MKRLKTKCKNPIYFEGKLTNFLIPSSIQKQQKTFVAKNLQLLPNFRFNILIVRMQILQFVAKRVNVAQTKNVGFD